MSIKIQGTTVIDDSKNLTNIANTALTGTVSANGSTGTAGQVLMSNGASPAYWATPSPSGPTKAQAIAYSMTLGF